ncbi:MAG: rod shape-determining protein MreD [Clostridia bacterium]|nr:rod shape-determining protein MreD [Clostridia bacterium]
MAKFFLGSIAQSRKVILRHLLVLSLGLLVASLLQVCVFGRYRPFGIVPDLTFCLVVGVGFFLGRFAGAVHGIAAGVLIEALGGTGLTLLPVFYLFCGYLVGHYARAIRPKRITVFLVSFGIALLLRSGMSITYLCISLEQINLPSILLNVILPEFLVTALCGCVLYYPIKLLCALLAEKGSGI